MKKLLPIAFLMFFSFVLGAQEEVSNQKDWSLDLATGPMILSSNTSLSNLMSENNYDGTSSGLFTDEINYPVKQVWPTIQLTLAHFIKEQQELGGSISLSAGETSGYNEQSNVKLTVKHFNYRFTLFYRVYSKAKLVHFQVGPSLNLGEYSRDNVLSTQVRRSDDFFYPGIMTGAGFSFIEKKNSFLRLNLSYYYIPVKIKIGPYMDYDHYTSSEMIIIFPEEKVLNQELTLSLVYGFRFRSW